ncbi:hypothetical protein ANCDUO_23962 [Ancylostoma duodenale]|uniref:Uncharacterized protein n=1 Tax=Ancylostoma duodenale TaxID=51022 RepID=A0A0C2BQC9_9BILA|nr:hypothetical protein ANCDUO_23962 [Ancylostoma duodenale]
MFRCWDGHVMRFNDNRWTRAVSDWTSRDVKCTTGRPPPRWSDFFTKSFKDRHYALRVPRTDRIHWTTLARERDKWKDCWRPLGIPEDQQEHLWGSPPPTNDRAPPDTHGGYDVRITMVNY